MEPIHTSWRARLTEKTHAFLRDSEGVKYFFATLLFIIILGVGMLAFMQPEMIKISNLSFSPKPKTVSVTKYYSPLTGVEVKNDTITKAEVTAIMLENSPSARPQSGLKDAGVVFEAIAEGGITRYIAFYQEKKPKLIGPVRSVRPYYIAWAKPFDASIVHVGGSFNALKEIRSGAYKDLDQFFNGRYFWRATDRYAPHNVYTNFDRLNSLNASKKYMHSKFTGFTREPLDSNGQPQKMSGKKATNISVSISSALYNVRYKYNAQDNNYHRFLGGAPHLDRERGLITPKVVIVMKVKTQLGWEDGYREQMTTEGDGPVYIFQNGVVIQGNWHKKSKGSQITFTTGGKQIPLARGNTWITVVAPEKTVSWQ